MPGLEPLGGHQPLVGERRRHPDVEDGDVGRIGDDARQELLANPRAWTVTCTPAVASSMARPCRNKVESSARATRTAPSP
jgi:hypothetical protein